MGIAIPSEDVAAVDGRTIWSLLIIVKLVATTDAGK